MSTQTDQAGQTILPPAPNPPSGTHVQIINNGQRTDAIMVGSVAVPVRKD